MQIKDLIPWARRDDMPATANANENPIVALHREMNRVFDSFVQRFGHLDWPLEGTIARSDMVETDDAVEVSIELPGMDMDDIEVSVSHDMLTIKGEKKIERQEEARGYYLSERSYGAIYRQIPLPPGVDGDKAEARFRNGVLTVRIPQTAEARADVRRIEVKAA